MTKKFCANCEAYRDTKAEDRIETYKVHGKSIPVPVRVDVCLTCGETLFDKERDSDMLHRVYTAYRRQEQLADAIEALTADEATKETEQ